MDKITHEMRLAHWSVQVRECNNSGMTARAWCAANNVGEKQYHYWKRRVRKAIAPELLLPASTDKRRNTFVEIPLPPSSMPPSPADAVLHLGGYVIEIRNTASGTLLESLLKAVSHVK